MRGDLSKDLREVDHNTLVCDAEDVMALIAKAADALDARDTLLQKIGNALLCHEWAENIKVEALSEIMATNDGKSDQPIGDILNGCIAELKEIPDRPNSGVWLPVREMLDTHLLHRLVKQEPDPPQPPEGE